jgi:hypothetical protein
MYLYKVYPNQTKPTYAPLFYSISLAQDRDIWRNLVNVVMKLRVP